MDMFLGKAFSVYVAHQKTIGVNVLKLKIVASVSNVPACIVHICKAELYMVGNTIHSTNPKKSNAQGKTTNSVPNGPIKAETIEKEHKAQCKST